MVDWRTDEMPEDGTVIYRRIIQPYRFLPYKPNSEEAKRGKRGRWQVMDEAGGWDNCGEPLGTEWTAENPFKTAEG
ncbi:hypothetical protein ACXHXG_25410 [Rhizobium sp. LEGMi198b]|uniref:hypothetical protein n=1 Tax=Rhizobium sp. CB3171 TaxID=3039157 RepID=UPI0024B23AD7|nr:hypothetical protein [Rhizobium sp. CB3171]WFU05605.1 hypothetical protein QA648_20720 [Rhizobium sp. CB3171]